MSLIFLFVGAECGVVPNESVKVCIFDLETHRISVLDLIDEVIEIILLELLRFISPSVPSG